MKLFFGSLKGTLMISSFIIQLRNKDKSNILIHQV